MTDVKKLLAEATPLPWEWDGPMGGLRTEQIAVVSTSGFERTPPADADLIVHAVNHLPDYLAAVDALEDMLDWAERYRGGDEKLHPEEYYIARDAGRIALRRLRGEA